MIAFTRDELLAWARARGASVKSMCRELGCTEYRYYKIREDDHWLSTVVLLEAATRCLRERGHIGLQTTLMHFCGEPEQRAA